MTKEALKFNLAQGFTEAEIKVIQTALGLEKTGMWSKELVAALVNFQEQEGIESDGMVQRTDHEKTWPALKSVAYDHISPKESCDFGMWVDDSPKTVLETDFLALAKELGIWNLALMVNKSNKKEDQPPWELRWKLDDIVAVATVAATMEMTITLTVWPRPSKDQFDEMFTALAPLDKMPALVAIEVATEANWDERYLEGFETMAHAGFHLAKRMHHFAKESGARLELTTFPTHPECGLDGVVSKFMDTVVVQGYSVRHLERDTEVWEVPWDHQYGPGQMQSWALGRAIHVPHVPALACGIATWDQVWPGYTPEAALDKAVRTAAACGAQEIRLKSSKWVVGECAQDFCQKYLL